ncbi:MAG: enoyl-CoA hydratase-related protein [Halobacteriota archaeon]
MVLSRKSIYATNFTNYGSTPGMSAAYTIPKKPGICLADELMMGGGNYWEVELEKLETPFPVLPRAEVLSHATHFATQLAGKPEFP